MINIYSSFTFFGIGPRNQMQDAGMFRRHTRQNQSWCIVCDGIGGQPGGAEASNICVREFDHFLSNSKTKVISNKVVDYLKFGLLTVMDAFYTQIQENNLLEHMGCTMSLFFLENDLATFCWCGDSRIYLFRNGRVFFKSLPHNPSFDEYRERKISLSQAEKNKTNIITRAIIADSAFPILESRKIKLQSGDRILLCTDGVWNKMNHRDLNNLATSENLKIAIKQIEQKLKTEADDNYWGWIGEIS